MNIRSVAIFALALAGAALAAAPSAPPAMADRAAAAAAPGTKLPAGWAASLDQAVDIPGQPSCKPLCFDLYDGPAPGQDMNAKPEADNGTGRIRGVSIPGLMVYLPSKEKLAASGGACVISCMGGAYDHLTRLVGADNTVQILVPQGIAVVSFKYRLTPATRDPEKDGVTDGKRAVRFVRAHAAEWGIDPNKVGMMGWSAGSNLILSLSTHLEKDGAGDPQAKDPIEHESCRPDFVTLLSPWPNAKPIAAYPPTKAEAGKSKGMPPAYIGSAQDDKTAPFTFAKAIQSGWETAGDQVQFDEIATGGHGAFELLTGTAKDWPERWFPWMEKMGMWKKQP